MAKQKQLQEQPQNNVQTENQPTPPRRARKIIILDHFGKRVLNVVLSILILSIFVPLIVFSFVQPTKLVDAPADKGAAYYKEYSDIKVNSLTTKTVSSGTTNITDIIFEKGLIVKKVTTTITESSTTVVVIRKLAIQDKNFIKANVTGMEDATDAAIADYIKTSTDYISITNTKTGDDWQITAESLTTKTHLEVGGTTYKECLVSLGFTETITTAKAKAEYNIFGLGYEYKDFVLTDNQGNILTFENNYFDKLTLADGTVYEMAVNSVSYSKLGIKNI